MFFSGAANIFLLFLFFQQSVVVRSAKPYCILTPDEREEVDALISFDTILSTFDRNLFTICLASRTPETLTLQGTADLPGTDAKEENFPISTPELEYFKPFAFFATEKECQEFEIQSINIYNNVPTWQTKLILRPDLEEYAPTNSYEEYRNLYECQLLEATKAYNLLDDPTIKQTWLISFSFSPGTNPIESQPFRDEWITLFRTSGFRIHSSIDGQEMILEGVASRNEVEEQLQRNNHLVSKYQVKPLFMKFDANVLVMDDLMQIFYATINDKLSYSSSGIGPSLNEDFLPWTHDTAALNYRTGISISAYYHFTPESSNNIDSSFLKSSSTSSSSSSSSPSSSTPTSATSSFKDYVSNPEEMKEKFMSICSQLDENNDPPSFSPSFMSEFVTVEQPANDKFTIQSTSQEATYNSTRQKIEYSPRARITSGQNFYKLALDVLQNVPAVVEITLLKNHFSLNKNGAFLTQSGEIYGQSNSIGTWMWHPAYDLTGDPESPIGVVDSGLDYNSCFFRDPSEPVTFTARNLYGRNVDYYSSTSNRKIREYIGFEDNNAGEIADHGTHVCGTVAGYDPTTSLNSPGINEYKGMSYLSKISILDTGRAGSPYLSIPGEITDYLIDQYSMNSRINTNSWGSSSQSYTDRNRDYDLFAYTNQDYLILFAAGNGGNAKSTIGNAANSKNVLSVGATQNDENNPDLFSFSSRGPTANTLIKPDICAPGYLQSANSAAIINSSINRLLDD